MEPSAPPSVRSRSPREPAEVPGLDPEMASLYEPAGPEDFRAHRNRVDKQETLMYGPQRLSRTQPSVRPYSPTTSSPPSKREENELYSQALTVSEIDADALPSGWLIDEAGYFQLTNRPSDFWEVRAVPL